MFKRWKELSNLDCVKEFGLGHKIGHFLGIHYVSKCFMNFGQVGIDDLVDKGK